MAIDFFNEYYFQGNIAEKYGAKWVFGGTILVTAILTLLTPLAARQSYGLLIALRVVMGMCSGPAFPSAAALWGKWVFDETKKIQYFCLSHRFHQENVVLFHQHLKQVQVWVLYLPLH